MSNLPVNRIFISFVLGFCGVLYELVFAQTLSMLFGQSVVQYSLTIGLFLLAMGAGSHWSWRGPSARAQLWRVQLVLSLAAPLLWLGVWYLGTGGFDFSARALAYFMCVVVGAVTGAELPLLFRCQDHFGSNSASPAGFVLSADYLGMLIACLAFPLWLLPSFGVFTILFAAALLNSLVMMSLQFRRWSTLIPLALLTAILFEANLREWLSQRLIG